MNKSKTILTNNLRWQRSRNAYQNIWMKLWAFKNKSLGLQYRLLAFGHACCAKIYVPISRLHARVFKRMRTGGKCMQLVMRLVSNLLSKLTDFLLKLAIFFLGRYELLVYRQCRRAELQKMIVHCNLQLIQFDGISTIDNRSDEFCCAAYRTNCCGDRSDIHAVSPKRNGRNSVADHTTSLRFVEGK